MVHRIIADRNQLKLLEVEHRVDRISYVFRNRDQGKIIFLQFSVAKTDL